MATDADSTEREEQLKEQFVEAVGYWPDGYDAWLDIDPDSFDAYRAFAAHPYERDHLSDKEKALIRVAITAAPTHLYTEGIRTQIGHAFDTGASVDEIREALELASVLGMHAIVDGVPRVVDELGRPGDADPETEAERDAVRELFEEKRGYWGEFWDLVLELDHEYLEKYTHLSGYPWETGALDPKLKEFVYIAIDISTTHLYHLGMEQHLENAIEYGATREELVELLELVSEQGYDTMAEAMPILREEAEKRGEL